MPYESTGRTGQKARTRDALISATRKLLTGGVTPTIEQAAQAAGISRTTAYRYFRNQRDLLLAAHPMIDRTTLLGNGAPREPEVRLDIALKELARLTLEAEPELRTMLRLSLDPAVPREPLVLRQGRAIGWLEDALSPLKRGLSEYEFRRLVLAIRAASGIEALVWLTDIAGLSRAEAVDLMHWSARALFRATLVEAKKHAGA